MSDARVTYNVSQSGKIWKVAELPAPLNTLDPATAAFADAVASLQSAKSVPADGKLGPGTLAAIKAPAAGAPAAPAAPINITEAALALIATATAEANKGVREVGKNAGPDVEKYLHCLGMTKGSPWCAAFVSWCVMTSRGLAKPPKWCSGSAVSLFQMSGKNAVKVTPVDADFKSKVKPGYIWSRAQDPAAAAAARKGSWCQGHTGIVVAVDAVGWHTIEGNTNAAGSREGDGVYRKTHKWSDAEIVGKTVGWFDPATV
jgi:hypothetical protein